MTKVTGFCGRSPRHFPTPANTPVRWRRRAWARTAAHKFRRTRDAWRRPRPVRADL